MPEIYLAILTNEIIPLRLTYKIARSRNVLFAMLAADADGADSRVTHTISAVWSTLVLC